MGRVAAVAQVHRRLYTSHDLKSVLLNQYLDALLEDLRRSAEGNRMSRLTLKAEPVEIDPDRAVAIGIIVNELVMNAVKYAYPDGAGPIHVDLEAQGDDLVLSIADDGVGLNVKTDPRSTGMGQRIVTAMASKLEASVERDPAHAGTRIVLRFRRVNEPARQARRPARRAEAPAAGHIGRSIWRHRPLVAAAPTLLCSPRMTSRDSASSEITPEVLLRAYACGIFPMAESADDPTLFWVEPEMRGVIPLDGFRISSRLARTVRSDAFTVTVDTAFKAVIAGCAAPQAGRDDTWINKRIRDLYVGLHELGHCHSVEVWRERRSGRRALWRQPRPRLLRREHVSPRPRRLEGGAGASGGAADRRRLRTARHPICHRASAQLRRGRNPAAALHRAARQGDRGARRILRKLPVDRPVSGARRARDHRRARLNAAPARYLKIPNRPPRLLRRGWRRRRLLLLLELRLRRRRRRTRRRLLRRRRASARRRRRRAASADRAAR